MYFSPNLEPVCSMSSSNCCFLTCIQISQEAGQVVWYYHFFQSFPQFGVIHRIKCFGVVNKAEIDVFSWNSRFFDDPADVGNLTSVSLTMLKPLTLGTTTNWKILKEMGIPDHLICLLRNLYASQEATVRTGHGTTHWFQT